MNKLSLVAFISIAFSSFDQIIFTESSAQLNINHSTVGSLFSGGVTVCDFNLDGLDDLTLASGLGDSIRFFQNTGSGFTQVTFPNISEMEETKQVAWIDFDNDGDLDLFVASYLAENNLYRNDGGMTFTDITMASGLSLGGSPTWTFDWGDYNRDGWIDLYVTNNVYGTALADVYTNYLYMNNGDGTFANKTNFALVADGNKNPLGSIFTDINNDMWPDLFVATDKMHGNALFKNNGVSGFSNISVASNANQHICSMNAGGGDCNNDGFIDLYVTNSPPGNVFLQNNGNETFDQVAATNGTGFYEESWGGIFFDADNDSDQDLYVSGGVNNSLYQCAAMYENDGSGMYTELTSGIGMDADTSRSYANAYADFNDDGFMDIVVNNAEPDSTTIWLNNGNANNWLKVRLIGTASNSMALGGVIEIYHNGTYQRRQHQCGNGFMNQNSSIENIGLGTDLIADSVVLSWPSGLVETYYNVNPNQTVTYTEGDIGPFVAFVFMEATPAMCSNVPAELFTNGRFTNVIWNGVTAGNRISDITAGFYSYVATAPDGSTIYSDTVEIAYTMPPMPTVSTTNATCSGMNNGTAISSTPSAQMIVAIEWSDNTMMANLSPGMHYMIEWDMMGCWDTTFFMISEPLAVGANPSIVHNDCFGGADGAINIMANGGNSVYTYLWNTMETTSSINNLPAGNYMVEILDGNNCSHIEIVTVNSGSEILPTGTTVPYAAVGTEGSIDITVTGGTGPYTFLWNNLETTEDISGLFPGVYTCIVTDDLGCTDSVAFFVNSIASIDENENPYFSVYPNPSQGVFTLSVNSDFNGVSEGEIIDIAGRTIETISIKGNATLEINLSNRETGIYFLNMVHEGLMVSIRLIVE